MLEKHTIGNGVTPGKNKFSQLPLSVRCFAMTFSSLTVSDTERPQIRAHFCGFVKQFGRKNSLQRPFFLQSNANFGKLVKISKKIRSEFIDLIDK